MVFQWYTTIAFGVIGMILCAFMPNIKTYMTNRVAAVSETQTIIQYPH